MKLRHLAAALLLATVGITGCSDDTDSNNSTDRGGLDAQIDTRDDASSDAGQPGEDASDDGEDDAGDDVTEEDASDGGNDAPEEDVGEDVDEVNADAGEGEDDAGDDSVCGDGNDNDCDYDGLLDCEEEVLGTDVCNHDTDNDGLTDMEEVVDGSDPLQADSDGDGLDDGAEVELGLDPNNEYSFDDGIPDADRWRVTACEEPSSEPADFYTSNNIDIEIDSDDSVEVNVGNWLMALPPAFGNYEELEISGLSVTNGELDDRKAAAVYDDPSNEVAGFLMSHTPDSSQSTPLDVLDDHRSSIAAEAQGPIVQGYNGGEFDTHDYQKAAIGRYLIDTSQMTYKELRDNLLFRMSTFSDSDVSGLPAASGATYDQYRIFVSSIYRDTSSGEQVLTSVAIAPAEKYDNREKVQFRMDDLVNTTNISEAADGQQVRCNVIEPKENAKADFYWVLDASGSMDSHYDSVEDVGNEFYNELTNTGLDFRLGVTTTEDTDQGRLRSGAGWHTDLNTFLDEIDYITSIGGVYEYGLEMAQAGIEYMKGITGSPPPNQRIRPDAQLITIWMSDEEEQNIQNNSLSGATGQQMLHNWIQFFSQHTVGFSIVGDGDGCGTHNGQAYKEVAQATGGSHASLCATDISETIQDIIFAATGYAGYQMPDTPISSTLRVFINGEWVPRSRENGFDYFSNTNSIAFFGDYQPEVAEGNETPDSISITYETFLDRSKD